jgi:hypothetical protein
MSHEVAATEVPAYSAEQISGASHRFKRIFFTGNSSFP